MSQARPAANGAGARHNTPVGKRGICSQSNPSGLCKWLFLVIASFAVDQSTALKAATADVLVVGSGIGGLSAAALLSRYGYRVSVLERHTIAGGAAHSFERGGYIFDSGPSLWSGCAVPSTNPLRQVLDAIDESPDWVQYDGWCMYTEQGDFYAKSGDNVDFERVLREYGSRDAVAQWRALREFIAPMQRAVQWAPPLALRADAGVVSTSLPWLPRLADYEIPIKAGLLSGPWEAVLDRAGVTDPFLRNWFDFLAFAFSGLRSDGTVAAAMVFMLADFYADGAKMDYPVGGSGAVVDALVRGVTKHGGSVRVGCEVSSLLVEEGRCVGVCLKDGEELRCTTAVISNADVWATAALLPPAMRAHFRGRDEGLDEATPETPSFMHLHIGFDAKGLSDQALRSIHHIVVPKWDLLDAPQSAVFVTMIGSPLTHARFLARHRGTYGPAIAAGKSTFAGAKSKLPGLLCCGDSTWPGIGVPAVAGSGIAAAHAIADADKQKQLLNDMRKRRVLVPEV
mmetsp:Transcript_5657/g.12400  ORF Transcript_5657/g.12400 Transcript_5657/m.12400 type:complete len:512 (-) Transcript_5657:559-2094(-)